MPGFADTADAPPTAERGWALLHAGDAAAAADVFARLPVEEGLPGLLVAAWSTGDPAIEGLLERVDPEAHGDALAIGAVIGAAGGGGRDLLQARCDGDSRSLACIDDELLDAGRVPRRCVAGCDGVVDLPIAMTHGGRIPIALVEVDGVKLPFVLDTAADLAVISADAVSRLGLDVDWSSTGVVNAYGAREAFPYAVAADVGLGDAHFADVPFAVLRGMEKNPWGDVVVGVINPLALAGERAVTMDLAEFRLILGGRSEERRSPATLELRRSLHKPLVVASIDGRPPRPLVIDTGAAASRVGSALSAMGTPWETVRSGDVGATGLGHSWVAPYVDDTLRARSGAWSWSFERPLIEESTPSSGPTWQIGGWGRIGTDVLMGRAVTVDPAAREIVMSRRARFPTMPEKSRRALLFSGSLLGEFTLTEELVSHDGDVVHLRYRHDWHNEGRRFDARVPFSRGNLYRWGHPLDTSWCETMADPYARYDHPNCEGLAAPFDDLVLDGARILGGSVREDADRDGLCVDERSEAFLEGRSVRVTETSCFANPWVFEAASVADAETGALLAGFTTAR